MSTFLQLCQDVARESGTVPTIGQPVTTSNQDGRLLRVINWTRDAYKDIQRKRRDWRWLFADFSGQTISGTRSYDSAALSISSRFSRWVHQGEGGDNPFTIYKTSEGQDTEGFLHFMEWDDFRRIALVGSEATRTGPPIYISEGTNRKLYLHPIPDAAYTVRGRYYKSPQILSADGNTPEMPEEFHEAIMWRALMRMAQFDEAMEQLPIFTKEYMRLYEDLVQHQTPMFMRAEPLA